MQESFNVDVSTFFSRWLSPELLEQWSKVRDCVRDLNLSTNPDVIYWPLGSIISIDFPGCENER